MSELQPKKGFTNTQTITFMIALSFICALILSLLASVLAQPKAAAKELDRSKQMMIAAKIFDHQGFFLVKDKAGKYVFAKYVKDGILAPTETPQEPTRDQIIEVYKKRFVPMLVNKQGKSFTFEQAGLSLESYLEDYKKSGYYRQAYMLYYEILPNPALQAADKKPLPEGYIIPVNGYGLWDAIYGYLALKPDGDTVIGISWYDQKETPGLGANIAEPPWQSLFPGKKIFQESPNGTIDFKTAPLGIVVVKGKVADVLGNVPKAKSAVDGMAGATLTGNGVTDAYHDVLSPYRAFLQNLHKTYEAEAKNGQQGAVK